jgi:transposase-like protein
MSLATLKKKFSSHIRSVHSNPREKMYSDKLKKAIVRSVEAGKATRYAIAKELTINPTLIYNWCR